MARLNSVHLNGIVSKKPEIRQIDNIDYLSFTVSIVQGSAYMAEDGEWDICYAEPEIITLEKTAKDAIRNLNEGDIVFIRGVVTTAKTTTRLVTCPECGKTKEISVNQTYITPLFLKKYGSVETPEEKNNYLLEIRHFSNEVNLMGRIARDPERIVINPGTIFERVVTQYQIAINRTFRIEGAPPELKADYPWVKSYKEDAETDYLRLKRGSIILITGFLQTRDTTQHTTCEECNSHFNWKNKVCEIVPHDTEYISGYRSDEEVDEIVRKREEKANKDRQFLKDIPLY